MMKQSAFIITGRSGSGKGTQIELLKNFIQTIDTDRFPQVFICGDTFRNFFKEESYLSELVKDSVTQGNYQPDFFATTLFFKHIFETLQKGSHVLFDGYPRSLRQLEDIKALLMYIGFENAYVIDIDVTEEEVLKRMLLRGRSDDNEEGARKRQAEFTHAVLPTLEMVKQDSFFTYIHIDGMPLPDVVHAEIVTQLKIHNSI